MRLSPGNVLYHLVCAAPPAVDVHDVVPVAQRAGWDVCVVATSRAAGWVDLDQLAALSGHPVRTDYKRFGEPDVLPPADAFLVAPATFNTLNKWASGVADTLVLGLLTEALGTGVPVVALPYLNAAQAAHPAFGPSVARLREAGVTVLLGPGGTEPHPPGQGRRADFPWETGLAALPALGPSGAL